MPLPNAGLTFAAVLIASIRSTAGCNPPLAAALPGTAHESFLQVFSYVQHKLTGITAQLREIVPEKLGNNLGTLSA
jgi:hypothetical protein